MVCWKPSVMVETYLETLEVVTGVRGYKKGAHQFSGWERVLV